MSPTAFAGIEDESTPDDPEAVWNGSEADTCAWPTTVMVTGDGSLCTGTLVHPQVVTYAAHCGDQNKVVRFGESDRSAKTITPEFCRINPGWSGSQGTDYAVCKLPYEIDLPVTPPITGNCETGVLTNNADIVIAGFGNSTDGAGSGTKRWAHTKLQSANYGSNVAYIAGGGLPTVLSGDSGGPAFIRYPDGSWHAFAIASTGTGEGGQAQHCMMYGAIPWVEEQTGIDVTPCFDDSGNWAPTPYCRNFFAGDAGVGAGVWGRTWCEGTTTVDWPDYCGDSFIDSDVEAPTISITSPVDQKSYDEPTTVKIEIEANDDLGVRFVQLLINGEIQGAPDTIAPYEYSDVTFPDGTWTIGAIATDWAGKESEAEEITLKIGSNNDDDSGDNSDGGSQNEEGSGGEASGEPPESEDSDGGSGMGGDGSDSGAEDVGEEEGGSFGEDGAAGFGGGEEQNPSGPKKSKGCNLSIGTDSNPTSPEALLFGFFGIWILRRRG